MTKVRSLLRRVQKQEQARQAPMSPFAAMCGSFEAFEAEMRARIGPGGLDREFELVLAAARVGSELGAMAAGEAALASQRGLGQMTESAAA